MVLVPLLSTTVRGRPAWGRRLYGIGIAPISVFYPAAPTIVTPIADQSISAGSQLSINLAASFVTHNHGDHLIFYGRQSSGFVLPSWLTLDLATGLLSGTPTLADVGARSIDRGRSR